MTSNKEDYLKALYDEGGYDHFVSNKAIAEKLDIAPASVSEMLSKLQNDGLIEYIAYHGSKLTEKGLESCMDVVRSHELWEVFLMRHLGYSWWEAHEEAHLLEHIASERMINRLDDFLGHPATCPHGAPIPRSGQPILQPYSSKKLCELKSGENARVSRICEDKRLLDYLEKSGIRVGKDIRILSKEDYEGPITFEQDGKLISISYKAAEQIFVESKDKD